MQVEYKTNKLEKICTIYEEAKKKYGDKMAEKIHQRIDEITAAESVEFMVQFRLGRCHALVGDRKGEYAVDLIQPYRLIFEKVGDNIQIAKIVEIADYH